MNEGNFTRRRFIQGGLAAGAAAGAFASRLEAAGFARVPGANERIHVGQIGCGGRNGSHTTSVWQANEHGANAEVIAACDIWVQQMERFAANIKRLFKNEPKRFRDYRTSTPSSSPRPITSTAGSWRTPCGRGRTSTSRSRSRSACPS